MSEPDPGREQPGHEHDAHHRAAEPARLHHQERAGERRAEQRADRGEAPGGADHDARLVRRIALDQMDGEHPQAAADRDQRRLGAEHDPEAERGERRDDDPGKLDGCNGPPVLNPSAGLCPAVPGRYRIVRATSRPLSASSGIGHHEGWLSKPRSPGRVANTYCCVSATALRKKYATAATGTPIDRAEDEQREIALAPQQLARVGSRVEMECGIVTASEE